MAVSVSSLIDRAYRLATGVGADAHVSPIIDNVWAFEEAFPIALRAAVKDEALSAQEIEALKRTWEITFVNGVAAFADEILGEHMDCSELYDPADVIELNSFQVRWGSFLRPAQTALGHYAVKGDTEAEHELHYREPNGDIATYDGDKILVAVSLPTIPANITGTMDIPVDTAERVVQILAEMVRGRASA